MKKPLLFLFFAVFALFFADCKLNRPGEDVDFLVPSEFAVDLLERFDSTGGPTELGLIFRSFKTFPCQNTGLKTELRWSKDSATLEVLEVLQPAVCETADAPIEQFIALGAVKNGRFPLTVILGEVVVNRGSISVSDAEILIEFADQNGIRVNRPTLRRVPDEAIWGKISFESPTELATAEAFLRGLDSLAAATDYNTGYYGQFTLVSPSAATVHLPAKGPFSRDFVRQSSRPASDFEALLTRFRTDPAAPLSIQFWTKKGVR